MNSSSMLPRILIVDDELMHVRALCDTLRGQAYDTTGLDSGEAVLSLLVIESFDLLLVDLMMPGMNGIAVVEAARQIDPDLACIIMTGEGTIASAVQAMKAGALDYVVKPFKVSGILLILARALETRQLRIANARLELLLRQHTAELDAMNKDLQLAREVAERANQEKTNFLSSMSHELRTPLNAVLGFSQMLMSDSIPSTAQEKKTFASHIFGAGRHLLTLINDILDIARIESGNLSLSMEAVGLTDIYHECWKMMEPLAHKRGITLTFVEAGGLHVLADRTRLKQVLLNLLSNAVKYNCEQGQIHVDCQPVDAHQLRLSVRDTGGGLSAAQLEALFQPYNRLGRDVRDEEGTGLGLVVSKRLAEAMQASIGVASTPGRGSTFWIDIASCPARQPLQESARLPVFHRVEEPMCLPERKTLLYVEDNPLNVTLVAGLIHFRPDLDLLSASDGQTGLDMARHHLPQLILMDSDLPDISGTQVMQLLRADPRTAHIPVIALTAMTRPGDIHQGLAAGFYRYLTKPIDVLAFFEAINSALESATAQRSA
ncbi:MULTISPECIES: response regulator [unclassified Janthinobacterium]|uniref:response regulator n=1 Tax=unclassified Janthinobacterium TaxID=2610881 RepID=UPI001A1A06BB|nr:response regulator [Janthinobacterium sp. CG_23.4]MDH6158268.1 signal transduction histidine kinase [Janthinobacterium sp. CG_23.4]